AASAAMPAPADGAFARERARRPRRSRWRNRARAGARPSSLIGRAVDDRVVRRAGRDAKLGQRLARLVGSAAFLRRVGGMVAARAADDRAKQDEEKRKGQPGQADADALGAASGL